MAANRLLVLVAVGSGLITSCSPSGGAAVGLRASPAAIGCHPASSEYRELFENGSITGEPVESAILVKDSAVEGAWYVMAWIEGSAAVWVTDRDPRGAVVGHISDANKAAQRLSNFDFVDGPMSMSTLAQAGGDPPRIEVAELCVRG